MKQVKKYELNTELSAPHTGQMLTALYKKRRISKAALARKLNRRASTMADYVKNSTIQTAILWEISHALKHNFFLDIAAQLPDTFATNVPADTSKDEKIVQLEQENLILKAKVEVLLLKG